MAASRYIRALRSGGLILALAVVLCMSHSLVLNAAPIAWTDNATGLAIGGYDPVAYFTANKPRLGQKSNEHRFGARTWRFANPGNRDAFAKHPMAYLPRFAGYDSEALARGMTVEGSPVVWALHGGAVYFFRDAASLAKWRADPAAMIKLAEKNWQKLARDLPGTSRH